MSGYRGATKVATGIWRRQGGTYAAEVVVDWSRTRRTFQTLEEAQAWRDEMVASRPARSSMTTSAHTTSRRETIRDVLAAAPRTEIERDGRVFTVIRLPDMEAA